MPNDRDPIEATTIVDMRRGESQLITADFGLRLNTGETLSSVATQPTQSDSPTAGTGETATLTVESGAINTGGAVTVDRSSRPVATVCQFRVTVPSNAALGTYKIALDCNTNASNVKGHVAVLRIW